MTMSDFEKQLKQFVPEKPSTDVGELLYQCGWNAREAANAPTCVKGSRKLIPTFLAGIACGLMASVATFMWQPSTNSTPTVVKAEPQIEANAPSPVANEPKVELANNEVANSTLADASEQPTEINTEPSGWQVQDLFAADQLTASSNSPLSFVARERWRQQLQSVELPSADDSAAIDMFRDGTEPLRAGPMNKKLLEELFL